MGDRLATTDMAMAAVPLSVGELVTIEYNVAWAEAYLCTKWHPDLSSRLATIHQCYRQDRQDRTETGHRSDSTRRTVYKRSPKNVVKYKKKRLKPKNVR